MQYVCLVILLATHSVVCASSSSSSDSSPSSDASGQQFSLMDCVERAEPEQKKSFEQARLEIMMDRTKYGDTVERFKKHEQQIAALQQRVDKLLEDQQQARQKEKSLRKKIAVLEQKVSCLERQNVADV